MTARDEIKWWGAGLVVLVLLLWLLSGALLPFVVGAALAYLTDPLADRLERMGMSRAVATSVITVFVVGLAALAILLIVPVLVTQIRGAIANAPVYLEHLRGFVAKWMPSIVDANGPVKAALEALKTRAQDSGLAVIQRVLTGGLAVIDFLSLLVITPVVAFYLLLDWDRLVAWLDDALPREHRDTIRKLMAELDQVLAGFVRGQLSVCLMLGTFYAVSLTVIGLDFGLLIGAVAGLISFIPFVGSILGGVMSIGVAVAQFWGDWVMIGAVIAVFIVGQMLEGHVLTPKFVGGRIGLHPVWLIFALSAFGTLFGPVGLLVAVPVSAAIGVFGRFAVARYKQGALYTGGGRGE